jgi:nucleolar protein 53
LIVLASRFYSRTPLTSTKILSERSAVPAVFSRPSKATSKRKAGQLSHEEKARLLKVAKRPRKGPFNSILDPSEYKARSGMVGLSEAVKSSGMYDTSAPEVAMGVLSDGMETVQMKVINSTITDLGLATDSKVCPDIIRVLAIVQPHQRMSYETPAEAHQELTYEAEQEKLRQAEKLAEVKKKMEEAYAVESYEGWLLA